MKRKSLIFVLPLMLALFNCQKSDELLIPETDGANSLKSTGSRIYRIDLQHCRVARTHFERKPSCEHTQNFGFGEQLRHCAGAGRF
jgi:hypothetical protein